jgi:hypothetical protein
MDTLPQAQARTSNLSYFAFLLVSFQISSGSETHALHKFMFFMLQGPRQDPSAVYNLQATILKRTLEAERFRDWIFRNGTSAPGYNESIPLLNGTENDIHMTPTYNLSFHLPQLQPAVLLPLVEQLHQQPEHPVYFKNVTGFLKGQWARLNVSLPDSIAPINQTIWANMTEETQTAYNASLPEQQRGYFNWSMTEDNNMEWNLREKEIKDDVHDIWFVRGGAEFKRGDRVVELDVDGVQCVSSKLCSPKLISHQLSGERLVLCSSNRS